jgi:nucleoside-diphosphate-sugar epimerase
MQRLRPEQAWKRVLITGWSGYMGPIMARVLEQHGHEVAGLDTGYFEDCSMEPALDRGPLMRKDVRDVQPLDLAGFDAVIHLAALSNDPIGELSPEWTYQINLEGSLHLARVAREAGVSRFLFSSSCSVYGASDREKAAETAPLRPLSAYAVAKARTEEELERLADRDFSPVFLRNATAYGASPRMRLDLVLNNLTAWAFTTGRVRIMSDGAPWRPLVHIEDIARAFAAVLEAPRDDIHGQAFNVGVDTENYQVKDLAELVREAVPNSAVVYSGQSAPDPRSYRVDFGKIGRIVPAFQPLWNARKGVAELCQAFQKASLKADDLQSRNYIRLKQLQHLLDTQELDEDLRWKKVARAVKS